MIPIRCTQVEVHLFRRRARKVEFLLLRRSAHRSLAGVWQPVTGGIERGERSDQAAAREVSEETALAPLRWWALERPTAFYDPASDQIRLVPVFAAEVAWTDPVHLSSEHDAYAFVAAATAARRVLWQTQRDALAAIRRDVLANPTLAAARDVTARMRPVSAAQPRRPRR